MQGAGIVAGMWESPTKGRSCCHMISPPFNLVDLTHFTVGENRGYRRGETVFSVSQSWQGTDS